MLASSDYQGPAGSACSSVHQTEMVSPSNEATAKSNSENRTADSINSLYNQPKHSTPSNTETTISEENRKRLNPGTDGCPTRMKEANKSDLPPLSTYNLNSSPVNLPGDETHFGFANPSNGTAGTSSFAQNRVDLLPENFSRVRRPRSKHYTPLELQNQPKGPSQRKGGRLHLITETQALVGDKHNNIGNHTLEPLTDEGDRSLISQIGGRKILRDNSDDPVTCTEENRVQKGCIIEVGSMISNLDNEVIEGTKSKELSRNPKKVSAEVSGVQNLRVLQDSEVDRFADSPNVISVGDSSFYNGYECPYNRNGTGVFLPLLEHGTGVFHPKLEFLENLDKVDEESKPVSIEALPDEVQEVILTFLPLACILRASCVCKKWNQIVHSGNFKRNREGILSEKMNPWYFMFTTSNGPIGYLYDPVQQHWYDFEFPVIIKDTWKISASCGLICLMQEEKCNFEIYVCNPMTKKQIYIEGPLIEQESVYSTLAFSVDEPSHKYTIAIVRSWQVQDSFSRWSTSIHIYSSETMTWQLPSAESLDGWRAGTDSVICGGVLYFVITKIGMTNSHALLAYDLKSSSSKCKLIGTLIPIPFNLTCVRLMNLQNKLVMVGGQGRHDVPVRIGIWTLNRTVWEGVSRVPHNFFQKLGELDDVFASSGTGDLIYIHTYGSTALIVFDINRKLWRWCQKCPMAKKTELQLFSGFCFSPRLDISPFSSTSET